MLENYLETDKVPGPDWSYRSAGGGTGHLILVPGGFTPVGGRSGTCVCVCGGMEWEGNIVVGHGRWLLEDKETGRVPELSSFKTPMQRPSGNQEMAE